MGAWIETLDNSGAPRHCSVAPFVGAWIETAYLSAVYRGMYRSHPLWVRGLKLQPIIEAVNLW